MRNITSGIFQLLTVFSNIIVFKVKRSILIMNLIRKGHYFFFPKRKPCNFTLQCIFHHLFPSYFFFPSIQFLKVFPSTNIDVAHLDVTCCPRTHKKLRSDKYVWEIFKILVIVLSFFRKIFSPFQKRAFLAHSYVCFYALKLYTIIYGCCRIFIAICILTLLSYILLLLFSVQ